MAKVSDIKRGAIVEVDGHPHIVEELTVSTPSARGGASLYRFRFRNVATKQKLDKTLKGDDTLRDVAFERREVQFSYKQGDRYTFMDLENFNEFVLGSDELGDDVHYIVEDCEGLRALVTDGRIIGIELPTAVDIDVVETGPSIKGASATARTKTATLATGLVVQVPEYLAQGERIRVDTRTGRFLSRA